MNLVFLTGKIVSNIEFQFILNSYYISIATFVLQLDNKSKIITKAYDEIADKCYKKLLKNDIIVIRGEINSKMEIIINDFHVI